MAATRMETRQELFTTRKNADLTIYYAGGEVCKVHRDIITKQSRRLGRLIEGKESINLRECDLGATKAMIKFCYEQQYKDDLRTNTDNLCPALFHTRVFLIADKYEIVELRKLAERKAKGTLVLRWKEDVFADCISEIYKATDKHVHKHCHELRRCVVRIARQVACDLMDSHPLYAKFEAMARKTPYFSYDLALALKRGNSNAVATPESISHESDALEAAGELTEQTCSLPEISPASTNTANEISTRVPTKQTYTCPQCLAHFQQTLWDHDTFKHYCAKRRIEMQPETWTAYSGQTVLCSVAIRIDASAFRSRSTATIKERCNQTTRPEGCFVNAS